jgi:hypothetical protein
MTIIERMFGQAIRTLETIEGGLRELSDRLDSLNPDQAMTLADHLGRCDRLLSGLKLRCSAALPDDTHFASTPDRTTARFAARTFGCSVTEAHDTITTGTALSSLPATDTAVRAGLLSGPQARAVVDGASVDPDAEADLLDCARRESLYRLRQRTIEAKATTGDDAARHQRAHRQRHLRVTCRPDAAGGNITGTGTATDTAVLLRALRTKHQQLFTAAMANQERPSYEALTWDALIAICRDYLDEPDTAVDGEPTPGVGSAAIADRGATNAEPTAQAKPSTTRRRRNVNQAPAAAKVIFGVDYTAAARGHPIAGERCDIAGYGPIPVTALREILATDDPFIAAVLTCAQQVTHVAHLGRRPNALQRTALEWLHPTCSVAGCDNSILDWDHTVDYAATHHTLLEELTGHCKPDHRLKTNHNWRLAQGAGRQPLVAPTDPRHPGTPTPTPNPQTHSP